MNQKLTRLKYDLQTSRERENMSSRPFYYSIDTQSIVHPTSNETFSNRVNIDSVLKGLTVKNTKAFTKPVDIQSIASPPTYIYPLKMHTTRTTNIDRRNPVVISNDKSDPFAGFQILTYLPVLK